MDVPVVEEQHRHRALFLGFLDLHRVCQSVHQHHLPPVIRLGAVGGLRHDPAERGEAGADPLKGLLHRAFNGHEGLHRIADVSHILRHLRVIAEGVQQPFQVFQAVLLLLKAGNADPARDAPGVFHQSVPAHIMEYLSFFLVHLPQIHTAPPQYL